MPKVTENEERELKRELQKLNITFLNKIRENAEVIDRKLTKEKVYQLTEFIEKEESMRAEKLIEIKNNLGKEREQVQKLEMMVAEKHKSEVLREMLEENMTNLDEISLHESDAEDIIATKYQQLYQYEQQLQQQIDKYNKPDLLPKLQHQKTGLSFCGLLKAKTLNKMRKAKKVIRNARTTNYDEIEETDEEDEVDVSLSKTSSFSSNTISSTSSEGTKP